MTTSPLEARIQAVASTTLTPIVLKALQRDNGALTDWTIEPLKVTAGVGAMDGAAVGIASVGLDPAQLLWIAIAQLGFRNPNADQAQFSAQEQAIFAGYLAGLQAEGWTGDPRLVRLGYMTALLRQRMGSTRSVSLLLAGTIPPSLAKYLAAGATLRDYADILRQNSQFFNDLFQESLALRDALL